MRHICTDFILRLLAACVAALPCTVAWATSASDSTSCPVLQLQVERLPDMQVARCCHALLCLNGELTAIGGHTDGFVPTPTAEYFSDGEWHLMDMPYTADFSLALPLTSGKVLLAGGMEENLGIGRLWTVQSYDPATRTFKGFGCLDHKRSMASGAELDSGRVVIAGNWYGGDSIELFDGTDQFTYVKPVAQTRAYPYIFRTSKDNAIILGSTTPRGGCYDTIWVDRFRGEPFRVPLLDTWKPQYTMGWDHPMMQSFIGDEEAGIYAYLLPLQRADSAMAIGLLRGEEFSLLPTQTPVPNRVAGHAIYYSSYSFVVDRRMHYAYLLGFTFDARLCLLRVDYTGALEGQPATMKLFYTEPMSDFAFHTPVLLPDGNLVIAGGNQVWTPKGFLSNNYLPSRTVYLLRMNPDSSELTAARSNWWWAVVAVALLLGAALLRFLRKPVNGGDETGLSGVNGDGGVDGLSGDNGLNGDDGLNGGDEADEADESLFRRSCAVMGEQQLFLRSDLKLSDVAEELGVPRTAVSNCIRTRRDCTFPYFVGEYRVDYVKQLMIQRPEAKISSLYTEAGFANETSFFRTFKEFTGTTPSEWRDANLQKM